MVGETTASDGASDPRGFDRARQAAEDRTGAAPLRPRPIEGVSAPVVETEGIAAAEASGKLQPDNDAPPEATAGSG